MPTTVNPTPGSPGASAAAYVRGPWSSTWGRLKNDRVALASGITVAAVLLLCFVGAPVFSHLLGHGPDDPFPFATSDVDLKPVGPWTRVPDLTTVAPVTKDTPTTLFVLGADGTLGRDEFLRLLYGGQVTLEVALGAALLALLIGVPLGIVAGFYGGWADSLISRATELVMGFPLLLFLVAIGYTIGRRYEYISFHGAIRPGVLVLVFLIGVFSWFYPARIIRAQVLTLSREEFVEAARMVGASEARIMRTHILPHLVAPMIIWATLMTAGTAVFEAAISVLNIGIKLPTASWGNMLSTNWGTLLKFDPSRNPYDVVIGKSNWVLFWPTAALFLTVIALTLFGEGVRRALEPGAID